MYEYDPFANNNVYDIPVIGPESIPLLKFTYQIVPEVRPVSVNVMLYLTSEKVIELENEVPLTVKDPECNEGSYILSVVDIV